MKIKLMHDNHSLDLDPALEFDLRRLDVCSLILLKLELKQFMDPGNLRWTIKLVYDNQSLDLDLWHDTQSYQAGIGKKNRKFWVDQEWTWQEIQLLKFMIVKCKCS